MSMNPTHPSSVDATPEQVSMARRIAAASYVGSDKWHYGLRSDILSGNCDDGPVVSAALAAIIETTEAAARLIDHQTPPPAGGPLSHTNSMRVVMQDAARSLRNNAHLKAPHS